MHNQPDPSQAQSPDAARSAPLSASRRQLLRAAASTAPLIATLPSGAAMASASAFQCLTPLLDAARNGQPTGVVTADDEYIRVPANAVDYKVGAVVTGSRYRFTFRNSSVDVNQDGNKWGSVPPPPGFPTPPKSVQLLVLYRSYNNGSDPVTVNENCELKSVSGWSPTTPTNCVWPIAKVQTSQPGGNLGMFQSCWCSLNPNDPTCVL